MTFSVAGSVITQANESGISITGAASITGGVRFTCTQSWAVGNVVRITGTTDYNGNWMVAARTATTFDVLESAQGTAITYVSSQSGTAARGDASLAGISGLTGVTTTNLDSSSGFVVYTLADNVKLQINGTLIIAGLRETNSILGQNELLVIGQDAISATQPIIRVGSGGVFVLGCKYTNVVNYTGTTAPSYTDTVSPQVVIYQKGRYGRVPNDGDGGGEPAPVTAFLAVANGGRFDWLSGTIDLWGAITVSSGGTANIGVDGLRTKPIVDMRRCSGTVWFMPGSSVSVYSLKIVGDRGINVGGTDNIGRGGSLSVLTPPLVFKGYEPLWLRVAIGGANGQGLGGSMTIEDYAGASGTELDLYKAVKPGETLTITYKNSAVGTSMTILDLSTGTVVAYVKQKLTATVKTTAGVAIENAQIWTIDLNSTQSLGTTDASGIATIDNVETGISPDGQNSVTARFATGDIATWNVRAYESLSAVYQVVMKGVGGSTVFPTLVNDASVTLSRSAAAALASISTLDDFYDAAKYWNVQSANVNYPTASTQVATAAGTTLDLGALNVLIDATAASAFSVNTGTNTITVKASTLAVGTKFALLKTTGTISFANGATASCTLRGIIVRGTTGVYSPKLETATMRFTTAGTYDMRGATISGTLTLTNTSGGNVTVQLQPSVTVVNSGPNITVDQTISANLTVSNCVSGSRILIRRTDTQAVLVNDLTTTSYVYNYSTASIPVEVVLRKASAAPYYQEWRTTLTLPSVDSAITANQITDE